MKALWIDQREGAISDLLLQLDYKATPIWCLQKDTERDRCTGTVKWLNLQLPLPLTLCERLNSKVLYTQKKWLLLLQVNTVHKSSVLHISFLGTKTEIIPLTKQPCQQTGLFCFLSKQNGLGRDYVSKSKGEGRRERRAKDGGVDSKITFVKSKEKTKIIPIMSKAKGNQGPQINLLATQVSKLKSK